MEDEPKSSDKCNSVPNSSRRVGILRRPDLEPNDFKSYPSSEIKLDFKELKLTVPDASLRTSPKKNASKSKDVHIESKTKVNMAYWLKPTPVQVYPYQFFIAACKKLEAITNPVVRGKTDDLIRKKNVNKSPLFEKISSEKNCNNTTSSDKKANRNSKLKSPKSSYNQQVPSLSTQGIDSLKVTSRSIEQKESNRKHTLDEHSFINSKRGCEDSSRPITSFEHNNKLTLIPEDLNRSNALEMLEIFNKGLSQAILDSRKLYNALSGSISARNRDDFDHKSPVNSYPATSVAYSSTFESLTESNDDPELLVTVGTINNSENIISTRNENESKEKKTTIKFSNAFEESVSDRDVTTGSQITSNEKSLSNEEKSNDLVNGKPLNSTNVQDMCSSELITNKDNSFVNNVTIDQNQSKYIDFSRGSDNESNLKLNSTNQSIGSEVYTVLNQTDVEFSMYSENTVSYSRLGLVSAISLFMLSILIKHILFYIFSMSV